VAVGRVRRIHLFAYLPVVGLLPLLAVPIPTHFQATREVGTYFQALAIARDGLASYGYLTVREIPASLHLESVLAAPLVAAGYVEGVRLVSALAALGTVLLVAVVARRLFGAVAAVLAPALLWANPYFYRLAWAAMPEALTVFLTTAAVAATVAYVGFGRVPDVPRDTEGSLTFRPDRRWLLVALAALALAVLQHGWAATVAVPIAATLAVTRHRRGTLATLAVTGLALAAVAAIGTLQPAPPTRGFAVTATGLGVYLSPEWLGYWRSQFGSVPFFLAHGLHLVAGIAAGCYWSYRALRDAAPRVILLATWTASGLVLPFALPGGVLSFDSFYLWGTVAPLTLTAAGLGVAAVRRFATQAGRTDRPATGTVLGVAVGLLVALALCNAVVVEAGVGTEGPDDRIDTRTRTTPFDVNAGEGIAAGRALRERDVARLDRVTFVGRWRTGESVYTGGITRIVVYGGVLPTGTWRVTPARADEGPAVVASSDAATDCAVMVVRDPNGDVSVRSC
jgi:hypothetical protein